MRYIITALLLTMLAPAVAFAAGANEPTLSQMLSRTAAIAAMNSGKSLACAMGTDRTIVKTGETFVLAWGTYGAAEPGTTGKSELEQRDEINVRAGVPGRWKYTLTFHDVEGGAVTCATFITVTE